MYAVYFVFLLILCILINITVYNARINPKAIFSWPGISTLKHGLSDMSITVNIKKGWSRNAHLEKERDF